MSTRVIVADSYNTKRYELVRIFNQNRDIRVIADCKIGSEVIRKIKAYSPNLVILGDKLKDMTVFNLVTKIMQEKPTPILIISNRNKSMLVDRPEALDYGIVDTIQMDSKYGKFTHPRELVTRAKVLARIDVSHFERQIKQINSKRSKKIELQERLRKQLRIGQQKTIVKSHTPVLKENFNSVVVFGASTGGPKMLVYILSQFPPNFIPPILVIQHLPKGFAKIFMQRVAQNARLPVKLPRSGEFLRAGTIYIAPGGRHMELEQMRSGKVRIVLTESPPVNYVRPSVDVTLFSCANIFKANVISAILTGMGHDGRDGSRVIKNQGGKVFALNEKESVIFGMNKAVAESGIADEVLGMDDIVKAIIQSDNPQISEV
ncbi:MAG: chemotaxis protein CheB [Candidatus Kariarchaeaceae archaeon]